MSFQITEEKSRDILFTPCAVCLLFIIVIGGLHSSFFFFKKFNLFYHWQIERTYEKRFAFIFREVVQQFNCYERFVLKLKLNPNSTFKLFKPRIS